MLIKSMRNGSGYLTGGSERKTCRFITGRGLFMKMIFILLSLSTIPVSSQKPYFSCTFTGFGDNREFHSGLSRAQTIFGTLGHAEVGTSIEGHTVAAGLSELYEFGSRIDFHSPRLILYYKFENPGLLFQFGSFPRLGRIDFPLAMLADTLLYYRPLVEGMFGRITRTWGHQLAFVDWTGRQTGTVREAFMAGSSGEISFGKGFIENYILLNHLAHSSVKPEGQHIKDYFGFSVLTGIRYGDENQMSGYLKGGILTSFYRERSVTEGFLDSHSFIMEGYSRFRNYAVKTILHSGGKHHFALGDPLYRFRNYWRTDLIWSFFRYKQVQARFNWSFHVVNRKNLDHSQQLMVVVSL
jgi:hypothetical protein